MLKHKMPNEKDIHNIPSPSGDRKKPVYKYVYDEKYGCPRRVLNGYVDFQDSIEEFKDDIDFSAIGKMLVDNRNNVISHFVSKDGEVVDVTGLPRNIHEINALHNKMKASFDGLDPEIRKIFNDDFDVFRSAYKKGNLAAMLQPKQEEVVTEQEGDK